jgi:flagellar biosynthesis/type III secretory pathway chaperone
MNQQPQAKQAPAPRPRITTPADARKLAEELLDVMSKLLGIVEQETELVRAGKVREAMQLEQEKSALSARYVTAVETLRVAQEHLAQVAPDLLASLRRHQETFRAMLQINLTVLATAHAVSEGILRGVNTEVQRRNAPNTYTAAGQRSAPGQRHATPLAVSRSL